MRVENLKAFYFPSGRSVDLDLHNFSLLTRTFLSATFTGGMVSFFLRQARG